MLLTESSGVEDEDKCVGEDRRLWYSSGRSCGRAVRAKWEAEQEGEVCVPLGSITCTGPRSDRWATQEAVKGAAFKLG